MAIDDPHWPRADRWLVADAESPDLVVAGVPSSCSSLTPSEARRMPGELRRVLARFSTYDGENDRDLTALAVRDAGDWPVPDEEPMTAAAAIRDAAAGLDAGPVHVFLGGDNAVTRPLVTGLWGGDLESVGVLTFDAHHDVRTLERGPTNGSPIRGLVADGVPPTQIVQIGIHTFANSAEYRAWCEEQGILVIPMRRIRKEGIDTVVNGALARLAGRCERIYVDFDIDVLDRAFAPACPGSRPGGMDPRELLRAAELCGAHPRVAACDLVEVDPAEDRDDLTLMNTAAVLLSFASGLVLRTEMQP